MHIYGYNTHAYITCRFLAVALVVMCTTIKWVANRNRNTQRVVRAKPTVLENH